MHDRGRSAGRWMTASSNPATHCFPNIVRVGRGDPVHGANLPGGKGVVLWSDQNRVDCRGYRLPQCTGSSFLLLFLAQGRRPNNAPKSNKFVMDCGTTRRKVTCTTLSRTGLRWRGTAMQSPARPRGPALGGTRVHHHRSVHIQRYLHTGFCRCIVECFCLISHNIHVIRIVSHDSSLECRPFFTQFLGFCFKRWLHTDPSTSQRLEG